MTPELKPGSDPVIAELRKLRLTIWLVFIFLVCCAAAFVIAVLHTPETPRKSVHDDSWIEVQASVDRLEYDRAIAMAKRIVTRFPEDHNGYAQLGHISLIVGDIKAAESYYSKAYELYPGDIYNKILFTIRQRIHKEAESPQTTATP